MWPFKKKKKQQEIQQQEPPVNGKWLIFNPGTGWEFAECQDCGYEVEDTLLYPDYCPGCGRRMAIYLAEDLT